MIGVICITATLILDKGKPTCRVSEHASLEHQGCPESANSQSTGSTSWSWNVATHKASITLFLSDSARVRYVDGVGITTRVHDRRLAIDESIRLWEWDGGGRGRYVDSDRSTTGKLSINAVSSHVSVQERRGRKVRGFDGSTYCPCLTYRSNS